MQLNFFNVYQQGLQNYTAGPERYSIGQAVNIGASELYSFSGSPMSYTQQVQRSAQMFADSGVQMLLAYARNVTVGWPTWKVNETVYLKFAVPPCPVLILVGTLDANTENGLGFWFQEGECY